jgi:hypothetical protein
MGEGPNDHVMLPFAMYPAGGRGRFRIVNGDNCRRGYGLDLMMRETKQHRCVYCGLELTHDYYTWLLTSVDHVVPKVMANRLDIPAELYEDGSNKALACSGCNGFCNHYDNPNEHPQGHWTNEEFWDLRDRVFRARFWAIAQRRADEMRFFDSRPWEIAET